MSSDTHTPRVSAELTSFIKAIRATVHTYIQTTSVIDNWEEVSPYMIKLTRTAALDSFSRTPAL